MYNVFNKVLDRLQCYYIKCPDNIVSDSYHKWGGMGHGVPVHYTYEFYLYANRCIEIITSGDKDWIRKCDRLYLELSMFYNSLIYEEDISLNNSLRRIEAKIKDADTPEKIEEAIAFSKELAESCKTPAARGEILSKIGEIYMNNGVGENSLETAIEYFRMALETDSANGRNNLFDALLTVGTQDSMLEAVHLVYPYAKEGDPESMARLGKAYELGKGAPLNMETAMKWYRLAAPKSEAARYDYSRIIWKLEDPELDKELFELISDVNTKNEMDHAYLSRLLRSGRGCERDLDQAVDHL